MSALGKWLLAAVIAVLVSVVVFEEARKATAPLMPDFSAKTLQGEEFRLADYQGKQPVLLSFYATWCSPCQLELPHLIRLSKKYESLGLKIVVLSEEPADVLAEHPVLKQAGLTIIPKAEAAFKLYEIRGIPHSFFATPDGSGMQIEGFSEEGMKDIEGRLVKFAEKSSTRK